MVPFPGINKSAKLLGVPLISGVSIILLVIPKGTTAYRVNNDDDNQKNNVDNGDLLPITLDIVKDTGLARLAIVAEFCGVIVPRVAIWISVGGIICWFGPHCWTHICEVAVIRRLTASWLHETDRSNSKKLKAIQGN